MKYFTSPSFPVVFLLILVLFSGCKPEYNVATIVAFIDGEPESTAVKEVVREQLSERLSQGYGNNFTLEEVADGFRIITAHRNQPIAAMAGLMGYFGSAEMGLYDVLSVNDPRLKPIMDSFAWPDYVTVPARFEPMERHLVATTSNAARIDQIQRDLTAMLPPELPVTFKWSPPQDPPLGQGGLRTYNLYALQIAEGRGRARIDNQGIATAKVQSTQQGQIAVMVTMTPEATKKWAVMTEEAVAGGNRPIAIVVNDQVVSSPAVMSAITGGMTQITGNFSVEEAEALAQQLKWAPLPLKLKITSQEVVE